jgi:hypothetical protein
VLGPLELRDGRDRLVTLGAPKQRTLLAVLLLQANRAVNIDLLVDAVWGELHTTIDVIRRVIDQAGIHRSAPKIRSARSRRRPTDQHLTTRAGQLGFADLETYLADHVTQRAVDAGPGRRRAGCGPQHR